jgi:hypothetical protein
MRYAKTQFAPNRVVIASGPLPCITAFLLFSDESEIIQQAIRADSARTVLAPRTDLRSFSNFWMWKFWRGTMRPLAPGRLGGAKGVGARRYGWTHRRAVDSAHRCDMCQLAS